MIKENVKQRWMLLAVLASAGIMYALLFYSETLARGYRSKSELAYLIMYAAAFLVVLFLPGKWIKDKLAPKALWIIRYRYAVTGILFLLLVAFGISGSSMNCLDAYFNESGEQVSRILAGTPRAIRSDEWFVNTEYHFAQVNGEEKFPVVNGNIGVDGQNMLLACNSPAFHITSVGKPQTWGYFLFGAERGLSWFWWFRFFALLLGAYELSFILTKKNVALSVFGAVLIGLSPVMTWWQSTTLVDLMIAGQWLFVSFYYFLFDKRKAVKAGMALLFAMSGVGYVISLYPAMQVPFGYLLLILMGYYLFHQRKEIRWDKYAAAFAAASVLLLAVTLAFFVKDSYADLLKVLNTAYPGRRQISTGSTNPLTVFYYLFSFLLPYREITFSNNCEVSAYLVFIPAFLVILYQFFRGHKRGGERTLVILLGVYALFLLSMCVVSYPPAILKVTLFSFTMVEKNLQIFGVAATYMLLLMMAARGERAVSSGKANLAVFAGISGAVSLTAVIKLHGGSYVHYAILAFCVLVFVFLELLLLVNRQGLMTAALICTLGFSSLCVNPLIAGADSMTDSEFIEAVREIDADRSGSWLITGTMVQQNVMAANGLHVVNATQYEPNLEYWSKFDRKGKYASVYNRYAHVIVELHEGKTSFESTSPDVMKILLSYQDIETSGVDYIVSDRREMQLVNQGILEQIRFCEKTNMYIYRVIH